MKLGTTESHSNFDDLEKMPVRTLLESINQEDQKVPLAVKDVILQIEKLVGPIVDRMKR